MQNIERVCRDGTPLFVILSICIIYYITIYKTQPESTLIFNYTNKKL